MIFCYAILLCYFVTGVNPSFLVCEPSGVIMLGNIGCHVCRDPCNVK